MASELTKEAVYDADRRDRRGWTLQRSPGLSRREALAQLGGLALGGAAAASGVSWPRRAFGQDAPPGVVKPTPENIFRMSPTRRCRSGSAN